VWLATRRSGCLALHPASTAKNWTSTISASLKETDMTLQGKKVTVHDMTLRDGMHPKRHLMTLDQMKAVATGLDAAGVPLIEVTHGDGLGGSSVNYGFPAHSDEDYLSTVIPLMKQAKVSALLLPGIGTVDHLKMAKELGVHTIRVATHCTEADVSEQHISFARKLDMDTVGFLMMAHMNSAEGLVRQAKLMESYGANCIYVTDSAGYMLPDDVTLKLGAVRAALKPETELGFHGHHNLAMGIANSIAAVQVGANRIDAAAAGLGAGAGNTPMEVFIAVCNRMGIDTGVDLFKIMDVAEDIVVPLMDHQIRIDRDALTLGYAGVYSSFLLFAKRAEKKYGISAREILIELGRRGMVGGQEDMIEDTAMTMARERGLLKTA
jgi:4-hydroxy-2-oxovalerate/4-hydroxy-2-oxohexanoate aldolase